VWWPDLLAGIRGLGHSCGNCSISLQTEAKWCGIFTPIAQPGRTELFLAAANGHLRHFPLHLNVAFKLLSLDIAAARETETEGPLKRNLP
jgi:hypothetical protein